MKNKSFLAALLIILVILTACTANIPESPSITDTRKEYPMTYSTNGLTVTVNDINPLEDPAYCDAEWLSITDYSFQNDCDLIVRAKVIDISEISMEYTKEITRTEYCSLIDLSIEEVYYSSDIMDPNMSTVRVSYEICSRMMPSDAVMLNEGESYYLILQKSSRSASPLGYEFFCDYCVRLPKTEECILKENMPMTREFASFLSQAYDDELVSDVIFEGANMDAALQELFGGTEK